MWGAGAVKAPDKCYESNTEGDQFGTSKNIYIIKKNTFSVATHMYTEK